MSRTYANRGLSIVEIEEDLGPDARVARTSAALQNGADVIVQAALSDGAWLGYADVLRRLASPSALGDWSYEPCDTKLARDTRGGTILQLAVYVDLLGAAQGRAPERFTVVTPGGADQPFVVRTYRYADFAAYVRMVRRQLQTTLVQGHEAIRQVHYPDPVEHCDVCRWADRCVARRRRDDHLSFVAGIGRVQREELTAHGFPTLAGAASMPLPIPFDPSRGSRDTYIRLREQARVQHEQRTSGRPVHELLPLLEGQGLARLPQPSKGDLFLDLEGAPFAREGGREYLFGLWRTDAAEVSGSPRYDARWALTDAEEQAAFEATIDRITATIAARPVAHVYHFGHYEPTALKRLAGRYVTRGAEMDELLRAGRFVDLYSIVRQSLVAGVESYSIKQLEQFYGFTREQALRDVRAHLYAVEIALESNAPGSIPQISRDAVERYNRDDCRSTERLRAWLEQLRTDIEASGRTVPRPVPRDGEASEQVSDLEARQLATRARLLEGLPADASSGAHPQHPDWLLAYLIDWHRREDKSAWWEYFRLRDLPENDLFDEPDALAGLEFVRRVDHVRHVRTGKPTGSVIDRYRYPPQEVELGQRGELSVPGGQQIGKLAAHERQQRAIDIRKGPCERRHPSDRGIRG